MAVGITEVGNWEASCWLSKHMDLHTVSPDAYVAMYANGPKWGNGNPLSGMKRSPDIIQAELPGCCRVKVWGGSDLLPHFPVSL